MKKKDVLRSAKKCLHILNEKYPDIEPIEMDEKWQKSKCAPIYMRIAHYKHVATHLQTFDFKDQGEREKMMRFLAWTQGALYEHMLCSIHDERETNRPN